MGTDWDEWTQPTLIIAVGMALIAGASLYVEWAIDRKIAMLQLEEDKAVAARFEEFREFERSVEVQLAEFKARLASVESRQRNGSNNGHKQENAARGR